MRCTYPQRLILRALVDDDRRCIVPYEKSYALVAIGIVLERIPTRTMKMLLDAHLVQQLRSRAQAYFRDDPKIYRLTTSGRHVATGRIAEPARAQEHAESATADDRASLPPRRGRNTDRSPGGTACRAEPRTASMEGQRQSVTGLPQPAGDRSAPQPGGVP